MVELNLPSVDMLEQTLYYLYTGRAPEPLLQCECTSSVTPDQLFGLLANNTFLLAEGLTHHRTDFLARLVPKGGYTSMSHRFSLYPYKAN